MGFIRKAMLSILASAALVATAAALARNLPPSEPKVAPNAAKPASNLPPTYFGPAYSAAAVYDYIRPRDVTANTRIGAARPRNCCGPRSMRP